MSEKNFLHSIFFVDWKKCGKTRKKRLLQFSSESEMLKQKSGFKSTDIDWGKIFRMPELSNLHTNASSKKKQIAVLLW